MSETGEDGRWLPSFWQGTAHAVRTGGRQLDLVQQVQNAREHVRKQPVPAAYSKTLQAAHTWRPLAGRRDAGRGCAAFGPGLGCQLTSGTLSQTRSKAMTCFLARLTSCGFAEQKK